MKIALPFFFSLFLHLFSATQTCDVLTTSLVSVPFRGIITWSFLKQQDSPPPYTPPCWQGLHSFIHFLFLSENSPLTFSSRRSVKHRE